MWRNETLLLLVGYGSRIAIVAAALTAISFLALLGMRIWVDSL